MFNAPIPTSPTLNISKTVSSLNVVENQLPKAASSSRINHSIDAILTNKSYPNEQNHCFSPLVNGQIVANNNDNFCGFGSFAQLDSFIGANKSKIKGRKNPYPFVPKRQKRLEKGNLLVKQPSNNNPDLLSMATTNWTFRLPPLPPQPHPSTLLQQLSLPPKFPPPPPPPSIPSLVNRLRQQQLNPNPNTPLLDHSNLQRQQHQFNFNLLSNQKSAAVAAVQPNQLAMYRCNLCCACFPDLTSLYSHKLLHDLTWLPDHLKNHCPFLWHLSQGRYPNCATVQLQQSQHQFMPNQANSSAVRQQKF